MGFLAKNAEIKRLINIRHNLLKLQQQNLEIQNNALKYLQSLTLVNRSLLTDDEWAGQCNFSVLSEKIRIATDVYKQAMNDCCQDTVALARINQKLKEIPSITRSQILLKDNTRTNILSMM